MICISIAEKNPAAAKQAIKSASANADIIEIRLDYFDTPPSPAELASIVKDKPCPLIATARSKSDGGASDWNDEVRFALLQQAVDCRFDYIDIEYQNANKITKSEHTKMILSYHNFTETPENLTQIYGQMKKHNPDIIKIATNAKCAEDNFTAIDILRSSASQPAICFCIGELGRASRVIGRKFGSVMTYAAASNGKETAAGQFTAGELTKVFNYKAINRDTKIYGLIGGDRISHSLSPRIHNAAFQATGVNAVYLPFRINGDPCSFIRESRGLIDGFSVTIPHKESVLPALDGVDDSARAIGAVNTILFQDGKFTGANTDCGGAVSAIEKALAGQAIAGLRAAVLGTGGAARAIAYGLIQKGASVTVYGRSEDRAKVFARELSCDWKLFRDIVLQASEIDIIANATSVGMYPEPDISPIPAEKLRENMLIFDAVYTPEKTRLLRDAISRGCRVASGMDMFIEQAAAQFKMRTGIHAPRGAMIAAARSKVQGE